MDSILPSAPGDLLRHAELIASAAAHEAAALDRDAAFPAATFAALGEAGVLAAAVPARLGGAGLDGGPGLLHLLHHLGRGSLAVGRIFEAHVNALRLVMRYGDDAQQRRAAADAGRGMLFALWVTDEPADPLRIVDDGADLALAGTKFFCSAAGHAQRAVVTARHGDGDVLLLLPLGGAEQVSRSGPSLQGMRASVTGKVGFTGCRIGADAIIGAAGDYLREPEFSTGAWRGSAVALGGLAALLAACREQLVARGRDGAPHQRARMGHAMIAHHTGWLWMERVAALVEAEDAAAVAYVNLARTAVEAGAMQAIQAVQRSLGLAGFLAGNPAERLCRDLATYLRQPAPDEVLDEAAAYFMTRTLPGGPA